ncbi:precorrin-3B synthase [Mycolicibacterium brumae]|uniref:Precorrin-3B synthase n=1 Tax=Mycolicibacterium brumae TaxID=85968 RepID=A0A2G5PA59_9MYCO|nr:precorrin-3B synthase [Mycolicibacterium brumae]MCV7192908.1 precorrin-3B synthase [Mycolicibacterium brumae]PIB75251.1 precorrin-3B synthase [Mycolicibacterium brumae]RWA23497.1 hypothetical protein MBRU_01350 [Mycolicibacterium brumae DSM 44177]UWW08573.1 precorrin-3B synthase [Mycolicibacterium brumae]
MARTRDQDACPSALRLHRAADGGLARVRLPGGMITHGQLHALALLAVEFGSGVLELTNRASLQIRGIAPADEAAVSEAVAAAGLLPSATHERARNIVASPLSGRSGGLSDIRPLVDELDAAICATPELADLPGRFLFALDDGRGDVAGLRADVCARTRADGSVAVSLAGVDTGVRIDPADTVEVLVTVARRFQRARGKAWRVAELPDSAVLLDGFPRCGGAGDRAPRTARGPIGWIDQDADGLVALAGAIPLGVLPARTAEFLAAIEAPLVVTPWRSVLVCDLTEGVADTALRVLAPMGLVFDAASQWLSVSCCTGSPGCEKSRADVRADTAAAVAGGPLHCADDETLGLADLLGERPEDGHLHVVGCERACGNPHIGELLVAGDAGYLRA